MVSGAFLQIECSEQPLDLAFHPNAPGIVAVGLVDGTVEVHDFTEFLEQDGAKKVDPDGDDDDDDEPDTIVSSTAVHTQLIPSKLDELRAIQACCRALTFSLDGTCLYTGGSAGDLACLDANRISTFSPKGHKALKWRIPEASCSKSAGIQVIKEFQRDGSRTLLATGDERGGVRLWDVKPMETNGGTPVVPLYSWKLHEDYISGIEVSDDGNTLVVSSADCTISVYDLKMMGEQPDKATRRSDDQEDELLSLQIMKNGRKVVCGTGEGVLSVFSWGIWGDVSDRFPGHPQSVDGLLKVDEDTLLTGSSDGLIRVVQIQPDKLLGVIGDHEGFPIEKLAFNSNHSFVGSLTHDNLIRIWDARILQDDDEGNEESSNGMNIDATAMALAQSKNVGEEEEDDWDDMDEDSDEELDDVDSDDSDDDSHGKDAGKKPSKNDKRKEKLKTDNEKFFEDL